MKGENRNDATTVADASQAHSMAACNYLLPRFTCLAERIRIGGEGGPRGRGLAVRTASRKKHSVQALDRIDCLGIVYQKTDRPLAGPLADYANIQVRHRCEHPADHVRLSSNILADQAHKCLVVFPTQIGCTLQVRSHSRQG